LRKGNWGGGDCKALSVPLEKGWGGGGGSGKRTNGGGGDRPPGKKRFSRVVGKVAIASLWKYRTYSGARTPHKTKDM